MNDFNPKEFKLVALRDCPVPEQMQICENPQQVADYWRMHIATHSYFNPDCECFVVLLLNTRKRVKGHHLVSIGTMDSILCRPLSVFRIAVLASAAGIIIMHNHPSGNETPSDADIRVTRDLIEGGRILKIEVLDHIVVGRPNSASLRSLGSLAF